MKKGYRSLDVRLAGQLSIVEALQESHSITVLCEAFEVHRSTFKYRRSAAARINPARVKLNAMVKYAHKISNGSAGASSIAQIVSAQGVPLSRYRGKVL